MSVPTDCEACAYETAPAWAAKWRCDCLGCDDTHLLCVNCGFRLGSPTHGSPVWAQLDSCPDAQMVVWEIMGHEDAGRGGIAHAHGVFAVLTPNLTDGEAQTLLEEAQSLGIPAEVIRRDSKVLGKAGLGLRLGDGREIWPR